MSSIFVVNADDLGVSRGATLGVIRAHLEGVVTSASLSPTGADYVHAVEKTRAICPDLGIGLHFTLSAGKPISKPADIPLLIGPRGHFRWEFISLFRALGARRSGALLEQIDIELEAQINKLEDDGICADHINSERHVHLIPGIFERVVRAAQRHDIPFVRGGRDLGPAVARPRHFKPVILQGGLLKYALLQGLTYFNQASRQNNTRVCDNFASYLFTGRLDLVLKQVLTKAPDGITEIMVHPGIPEESHDADLGNSGLEHYLKSADRLSELDACIEARSFAKDIVLRSFRELARL